MKSISKKYDPKTVELLIYVTDKLSKRDTYGATVLNKALYFIDNVSFLKRGKPISSLTYIKQKHGPTPEPSAYLSLREHLIEENQIQKIETEYFGRTQYKLIPKRSPNLNLFTKEEIQIIEEIVDEVAQFNGSQISDITHQYPSWIVANDREELPFYTFLLSSKQPGEKDISWAKKVVKDDLRSRKIN